MAQVASSLPTNEDAIDEQIELMASPIKEDVKIGGTEISGESQVSVAEVVIKTGADAAEHLLPLRDDFDPVVTFRSVVLATAVSGFQAVMTQIYSVSQHFPLVYACFWQALTPFNSSSQRPSPSREHLSSSSRTLWVKRGPHSFPVVINLRLVGGTKMVRACFLGGSRPSSLSTMVHGL
jgi:hypothetical protein